MFLLSCCCRRCLRCFRWRGCGCRRPPQQQQQQQQQQVLPIKLFGVYAGLILRQLLWKTCSKTKCTCIHRWRRKTRRRVLLVLQTVNQDIDLSSQEVAWMSAQNPKRKKKKHLYTCLKPVKYTEHARARCHHGAWLPELFCHHLLLDGFAYFALRNLAQLSGNGVCKNC